MVEYEHETVQLIVESMFLTTATITTGFSAYVPEYSLCLYSHQSQLKVSYILSSLLDYFLFGQHLL